MEVAFCSTVPVEAFLWRSRPVIPARSQCAVTQLTDEDTSKSSLITREYPRSLFTSSLRSQKFKFFGQQAVTSRTKKPETSIGKFQLRASRQSSSIAALPTWDEVFDEVKDALAVNRPKEGDRAVILYRDTHAWCPFCEKVWLTLEEKGIRYKEELINLRDKPKWYTNMVPTGRVPAISIDGVLTWESLDILKRLEDEFPQPSLYPEGRKDAALGLLDGLYTDVNARSAILSWLTNKDAAKEVELRETTLEQIALVETALAQKPYTDGPFFLGQFSIVDCAFSSLLESWAFRLPYYKNVQVRGNDKYPALTAWFDAMDSRPAYQRVKSDAASCCLIPNYAFNWPIPADAVFPSNGTFPSHSRVGRTSPRGAALYAAARLAVNHTTIIDDALRSATVAPLVENGINSDHARDAIDLHFRLLASALKDRYAPEAAPRPAAVPGESATSRQVGEAALRHVKGRVCVPRDMDVLSKTEFVATIEEILARHLVTT